MQIFNIGPLEFVAFLLIALIVLGPERIVNGARSAGRWINKMVRSPTWQSILSTSREIRELPQKIVAESGIKESMEEIQQTGKELTSELNQASVEVTNDLSAANFEINRQANRIEPPSASSLSLEPPSQTVLAPPATESEAAPAEAAAVDEPAPAVQADRPASAPPPRTFTDVFGSPAKPALEGDGGLEPPAQTVLPAEKKTARPRKVKESTPEPAPESLTELEAPAQTVLPVEKKTVRVRKVKAAAAQPTPDSLNELEAPAQALISPPEDVLPSITRPEN